MNHYKRYTLKEIARLDRIASLLKTIEKLDRYSKRLARLFGRTEGAIRKQIEKRNGWYYL